METARTLVIFGPTMMAAGALMNHTLTGTGYESGKLLVVCASVCVCECECV